MENFPKLLKLIRESADLTQEELSVALGVSKVLISMVETGQKQPSKKLVFKLAEKMGVHASSILPALYIENHLNKKNISNIEKSFISLGEKLQGYLIEQKAKNLKKYV